MQLKVLVANECAEQNALYCNYLTNDKDLEVLSTNNGISTLDTYIKLRPNILVLDSFFSDLKYTIILDNITKLENEHKNCNTIVTVNNELEQLELKRVEKVHSILKNPVTYTEFMKTLNLIKQEINTPEITRDEIDNLLFWLNIDVGSNGAYYIRNAIFYCYYNKDSFKSLDTIYNHVAENYHINADTVKSSIRSALVPLNNAYSPLDQENKLFNSIFGRNRGTISTKYFLEAFVIYLRHLKNKK